MDFWPNLELPDLAEHGWGLPFDPPTTPNKPFQWATHKSTNLLPAWCEQSQFKLTTFNILASVSTGIKWKVLHGYNCDKNAGDDFCDMRACWINGHSVVKYEVSMMIHDMKPVTHVSEQQISTI